MAIWDLVAEHESGTRVLERRQSMARRIMLCDDYLHAEEESPKIGDPYPTNSKLTVARVTVQGYGKPIGDGSQPNYELAKVTVEYAYPNLVADGTPLSSSQCSVQALAVGQGRTWASDNSPVGSESSIILPFYIREITFHTLKTIPPVVDCYLGNINASAWTDPVTGDTYPAETVQFAGISHTPQFDALIDGFCSNIEWKFLINPMGWNSYWRGDTGTWDQLSEPVQSAIDFMLLGI
jgi:hypothetical protein